jgi:hypothetical protein
MGRNVKQMVEEAIHFHGQIATYTGDCYKTTTVRKLTNLGATTYQVSIGNTTCHYFSTDLPSKKDFRFDYNSNIDSYFMSKLREYVKSSGYYKRSKRYAKRIKKIAQEGEL